MWLMVILTTAAAFNVQLGINTSHTEAEEAAFLLWRLQVCRASSIRSLHRDQQVFIILADGKDDSTSYSCFSLGWDSELG